MAKTVFIATRDLLFRSKLRAVVTSSGAEPATDEATCDLAVIEIESADWESRVRSWVARGTPVIAFGSHVRADLLRAARDAGAHAVPNSQVETTLREFTRAIA